MSQARCVCEWVSLLQLACTSPRTLIGVNSGTETAPGAWYCSKSSAGRTSTSTYPSACASATEATPTDGTAACLRSDCMTGHFSAGASARTTSERRQPRAAGRDALRLATLPLKGAWTRSDDMAQTAGAPSGYAAECSLLFLVEVPFWSRTISRRLKFSRFAPVPGCSTCSAPPGCPGRLQRRPPRCVRGRARRGGPR